MNSSGNPNTSKRRKNKAVVVGLDAATWDLIDPWIKEGKLPFLRSLKERGSHAQLRSTQPFLTPPAWTSIFTGVNPGKHGIFDFFEMKGDKKYPILSSDRKVDAVWQTASKAGKRVFVVGVPNTFPPDEVNGVMVAGIGSPGPDSEFVYPPNAKRDVLEILEGEDLFIKDIPQLFSRDKKLFLQKIHALMDRQKDLCLSFLTKAKWDLLITVFMGIDWIGHFFWKDMDESHPGYDPKSSPEYRGALLDIYVKMDQILLEIYEAVKDKAVFVVLSDHGMGPVHKDIYINTLLQKEGYLKARTPRKVKPTSRQKQLRSWVLKLIRVVDRFGLRHKVPLKSRVAFRKTVGLESRDFLDYIDWSETKAFSLSSSGQGIRLNLEGRYPQGIVNRKDREALVGKIRKLLEDLRDPETGKKVIKNTYSAEDVYSGSYLDDGPDILVETEGEYILNAELSDEVFGVAGHSGVQRSGEHREFGVFLADGGGREGDIGIVETYDVAPTILRVLRVKSGSLDGRPIQI